MTARKKRWVLALALCTTITLAATALVNHRAIQLEWWRWQAGRDGQSGAWIKLFQAGEEGFAHIARLLKDDGAEEAVEGFLQKDRLDWEPLHQYLRSRDPYGLLRFLFLGRGAPDGKRVFLHIRKNEQISNDQISWHSYWMDKEEHLEPTDQSIDFLEKLLSLPSTTNRIRAIGALGNMLRSGEVSAPQGPLAKRIVDLLAKFARDCTDLDMRYDAIVLMMRREKEIDVIEGLLMSIDDWQSMLDRAPAPDEGNFVDPYSIRALSYLDLPLTLRVFFRLQKLPKVAPRLNAVLSSRAALGPLPMPDWLPLDRSVRRLLDRPGLEPVVAATIAAEENLKDLRPSIWKAADHELDPNYRMLFGGSLLALGDEKQRPVIQSALLEMATENDKKGVGPTDLAHLLLLSGDRPTLERAFEKWRRLPIRLEKYVEGLPPEFKESTVDPEEKAAKLAAWWHENKSRVAWSPARRRFVLTPP